MTAPAEDTTTEEVVEDTTLVETIDGGDLEGAPELATYALEDNDLSDYYAAGKEYRTYANETDEPRWTEDERKLLGLDKSDADEGSEADAPAPSSSASASGDMKDARVTNDPKLSPAPPAAPTSK